MNAGLHIFNQAYNIFANRFSTEWYVIHHYVITLSANLYKSLTESSEVRVIHRSERELVASDEHGFDTS
jgi:hypothetical protein